MLTADGEKLSRYPLTVDQIFSPEASFLLNVNLQLAVQYGTGKGLSAYLPEHLGVAGKTGTTDDLRDSWFAGFTGDYLAVAWLGMDDNQTTKLSGSSGALQVWGEIMRSVRPQSLVLAPSENIEFAWIDTASGLKSAQDCEGAVQLPFIRNSVPTETASCRRDGLQWFRELFE